MRWIGCSLDLRYTGNVLSFPRQSFMGAMYYFVVALKQKLIDQCYFRRELTEYLPLHQRREYAMREGWHVALTGEREREREYSSYVHKQQIIAYIHLFHSDHFPSWSSPVNHRKLLFSAFTKGGFRRKREKSSWRISLDPASKKPLPLNVSPAPGAIP